MPTKNASLAFVLMMREAVKESLGEIGSETFDAFTARIAELEAELAAWKAFGKGPSDEHDRNPNGIHSTNLCRLCSAEDAAALAQIRAENVELRRDKGRLDWLEHMLSDVEHLEDGFSVSFYTQKGAGWAHEHVFGPTLRAAIDAAREDADAD